MPTKHIPAAMNGDEILTYVRPIMSFLEKGEPANFYLPFALIPPQFWSDARRCLDDHDIPQYFFDLLRDGDTRAMASFLDHIARPNIPCACAA